MRKQSTSLEAIRRKQYRKKKGIVTGKAVSNRDIERKQDRERKKYKRKLKKEAKKLGHRSTNPTNVPDINALTGFSKLREAKGEYQIKWNYVLHT